MPATVSSIAGLSVCITALLSAEKEDLLLY